LLRIQRTVEAKVEQVNRPEPAIDVALEVEIAGTPAEVFSALTRDPGGWWGHPFVHAKAIGLTLDPKLGGLLLEQWNEGGAIVAAVTGWQEDRHLTLTGPFHHVSLGVATFDLAPTDSGTLVRFSFRAVGAMDAELAEAMPGGWSELICNRLKALVESGTRLGISVDQTAGPIQRSTRRRANE
jgi:uncharacterized protein YndB with AHSA1/START domain